ncbi:hypothetical protein QWZ06_06465 [Chryseobacterium tructae]|uniref:Uncharacterized protein n=1 Tax=Chryseobacterium tructae TaxID=1037380 RepID=A0ABV7XUP5_9FLAO|nr:hypothetical protein [Chryseobacterium tructae]MDN3691922.1 hypothetical protein [Chryseobacterium tructae]
MTKTLKWMLIIISIGVVLYFGMSFLVVAGLSYFSSAKKIDSLPKEKILFAALKKEYHLTQIERSPETKEALLHPKDTLKYTLYLSIIDCDQKKENLERISKDVAFKINKLDLDQHFNKYELYFYCKQLPPGILKYEFLRKNLK